MKPSCLIGIEKILIAKLLMQCFLYRSKCSLLLGVSRQCVTCAMKKWTPTRATFGSRLSLLPMPHEHCKKELPDERVSNDMSGMTHLFDSKDIIIETTRTNDSSRRRTRSSKVEESACRTINFTTPMGLSFEHARAVGGRGSEKQIVEWWGSAVPHKMQLRQHKNHFAVNILPPPKPCWIATN